MKVITEEFELRGGEENNSYSEEKSDDRDGDHLAEFSVHRQTSSAPI